MIEATRESLNVYGFKCPSTEKNFEDENGDEDYEIPLCKLRRTDVDVKVLSRVKLYKLYLGVIREKKFKSRKNILPDSETCQLLPYKEIYKEFQYEIKSLDFKGAKMLERLYELQSKFKNTSTLKPEEVLDLLEIKKYAKEKGLKHWITKIEKIEKSYYGEDYVVPNWYKKAVLSIQKKPISIEEARKRLKRYIDTVNDRDYLKRYIRLLEVKMNLD